MYILLHQHFDSQFDNSPLIVKQEVQDNQPYITNLSNVLMTSVTVKVSLDFFSFK